MRSIPMLLLLASFQALSQDKPTLDFKGVGLGASEEDFLQAHPAYHCMSLPGNAMSDRLCSPDRELKCKISTSRTPDIECMKGVEKALTYGGVKVKAIYARFYTATGFGGVRITIDPANFERILAMLSEKYGKPTSFKPESIQNRMGATFENATAIWSMPNGKLRIEKYAERIDEGFVDIVSTEHFAEFTRRSAEKRKQGKSDL